MTVPTPTDAPLPTAIEGPLVVVGDLHGAAQLLDQLLVRLEAAVPDLADRWVVFAGDFPDRGPNTRRVIDTVLSLCDRHGRVAAVMGNHDLALVAATGLVPTPAASHWNLRYVADYDALPTFTSYGVPVTREAFEDLITDIRRVKPYYDPFHRLFSNGEVPAELVGLRDEVFGRVDGLLADLRDRMPERHRAFLVGLPWCVEHPQYVVVHAGLMEQPFEEQLRVLRARDFDNSRPPWLHERKLTFALPPADCPVAVVSGHTVVPKVEFLHGNRRILVDTFGGYGSVLSAVLLPEMTVVTSDE
jgi:hypothetical protein